MLMNKSQNIILGNNNYRKKENVWGETIIGVVSVNLSLHPQGRSEGVS